MPFQIKDFLSIVAGMVNHMRTTSRAITDFNVGSVARTMIEAPAIEIDELYQQMLAGLVEGIPTAVYRSFDFPLLPAVAASGLARFSAPAGHADAVVLPVGVRVASDSAVEYRTVEAAVIAVGQTSVEVLVSAVAPGSGGNALPDAVTRLISPISGVSAVTNPAALSNGRGAETEAERKLRFAEFIQSLARGTVGSLIFAAKAAKVTDPTGATTLERVARVAVREGPGHVRLYVHNGAGATSAQLVQAVTDRIEGGEDPATGTITPGYRPAGMRVDVEAMTEIPVAVAIRAQVPALRQTEETRGQVVAALSRVIRATRSGGELRPLDLVNATLALAEIQGAEIAQPTLSVPCPASAVLVPGAILVEWV